MLHFEMPALVYSARHNIELTVFSNGQFGEICTIW